MPFCDDFYNNLHIVDSKLESSDYAIISDKAFSYLYSIYGGTDIRRLSIKLQNIDTCEDMFQLKKHKKVEGFNEI